MLKPIPKIAKPKETPIHELPISIGDFMKFYNASIPETFPKATNPLLKKFKATNASLFKHGDLWTVDIHRKKIMDWLPAQIRAAE